MSRGRSLLLLTLLLLVGCARFRPEPLYIQFPAIPKLTWQLCDAEQPAKVCLSQADAALLNKWLDKVRAFEAARERLTKD